MIYLNELVKLINSLDIKGLENLKKLMIKTHKSGGVIYICGNGGSSANANHIANDLMLGFGKKKIGFKFVSLSSNFAQISCIANDLSYDDIYSHQINLLCQKKDLLILLSGSGNSKNIIKAIITAKKIKMNFFGIYGFDGGKAKKLSKNFIHIKTFDMQIAEDFQMIIFNYILKTIPSNQQKIFDKP